MINLEGIIDNITYHSKETHYTVAKLKTTDNKAVTITGVFPIINIGAHYRISGDWYFHNIYGRQFQVKNFEELLPQTLKGLERYLGSGLIKGIGKSTAEKLVKHFKFEILDILENNYQKLMEISGIGEYKAQTMALSFSEHKELKKIINFLGEFDLSTALAVKIYKYYGSNCIPILKNNPYQLADEIWGIGFKTADKIAQNIGLDKDSVLRINSGIIYVLKEALGNGHLFLPKEELLKTASTILETNLEKIEGSLIKLKEDKKIIFDDQDIYFTPYFLMEKKIARRIADFKKLTPYAKPALEDWEILEKNLKIQLTFLQKQAVEESLQEGILILSGGPGTGKTTTIKTILEWAKVSKLKISLAAPTGRAAKRLSETTALEALTIHRLLEYNPSSHEFQRNEYHKLKSNLFIIDEVSMIDAFLFNSLLKAIPLDSRLILVGDKDQLPSVGAGNILRDLIDSKLVKTIFLNQIFRQSEDSNIIINAHKINQGEMPDLYKKSKDFFFIYLEDSESILNTIINLTKNIHRKFNLNPKEDLQILTPMYRGIIGVENLNQTLQKFLNPPEVNKIELKIEGRIFRENDKVMQVKNNYDKGIFNGDIGIISEINLEDQEILVNFPAVGLVKYEYHELDELVLAYACSIHKSQGSEYPAIIMPVSTAHYIMLQRNLIYTAITRAKKIVILIGTKKALNIAIKNEKVAKRYTKLSQRLKECPDMENFLDLKC